MDDSEAMNSYYFQRGMGFRQTLNQNPSMPVHSLIGSAAPHGFNGGGGIAGSVTGSSGEPVKRKRGRPRKYGPNGSVDLVLSPLSSTPPGPALESGGPTQKRGRGRPKGSGARQQLASLGEWMLGSAGMGFTPHVIMIEIGEDIAAKIMSFSLQGPRTVCILSANGSVSSVTICQPDSSGGTITYEGLFEILSLSGSYLSSDGSGSQRRSGGLSISVSGPDCEIIGGYVGGLLIAARPVQVIVGSFMYDKAKSKKEAETGEKQNTPSTTGASPDRNICPSPVMGEWQGSRQMDFRNPNPNPNPNSGIDLR